MSRTLSPVRRTVALGAAVLTAVMLAVGSPAFAVAEPEPPARDGLTAENAGGVVAEQQGSRVALGVDDERVYAFVYAPDSDPVGVGWLEPSDGRVSIDLAIMPAGEIVIALVGGDGELIGWASTELGDADSHAPPPVDADGDTAADEDPVPVWPWILLAGAVLVAVLVLVVLIRRARRAGST